MAIFMQEVSADDDSEVPVMGSPESIVSVGMGSRVGIMVASWPLENRFENKYPNIYYGCDLGPVISNGETIQFFSDWFSNQNLPLVLKTLLKVSPAKIKKTLVADSRVSSDSQVANNLFEGRMTITNSILTTVLNEVARQLVDELGIDFAHAYRICFTLILAPKLRDMHMPLVAVIDSIEDHSEVIERARTKLVNRIVYLREF